MHVTIGSECLRSLSPCDNTDGRGRGLCPPPPPPSSLTPVRCPPTRPWYFWHFSSNHYFYRFILISSLATVNVLNSSLYNCRAKYPKNHRLEKAAIVGGGQYIPPVCRYFRLSHKTISSQKSPLPHQIYCKYIIFSGPCLLCHSMEAERKDQ